MKPKKRFLDSIIVWTNKPGKKSVCNKSASSIKKSKKQNSPKKNSIKKKSAQYQSTYTISKVFGTKNISEKYEHGLSDW